MSGVATAIGVGALATAAAGIGGAAIAGYYSGEAQKADEKFARENFAVQREADAQAQQRQQPYAQAGMGGVGGLQGYQAAGTDALAMQRALAGLDGPEAYQQAIAQVEGSPEFAAMMQQGEEALLQNASATGGLRGGNTQAALMQMRPAILSQLIEQQYGRLGGLAGAGQQAAGGIAQMGQAASAGQAAMGLQGGQNIGNVLGQIGASRAGGLMAQGAAYQQGLQSAGRGVAGGAGTYLGLKTTAPAAAAAPGAL